MIATPRLILRPWQESDRRPFAGLCADQDVMAYLMPLTTRQQSDGWIDRQIAHYQRHGFCFWAVERRDTRAFIGTVGLLQVGYPAHFTPAVEVGWRLDRRAWGQGYAVEAARAALASGFQQPDRAEIIANTVPHNVRSRRVMESLGMTHRAEDDFDHPLVPEGHPLRRQVLYRMSRARWLALDGGAAD
ncbi:GNAT family N-acetyltransferase [Affinibrenneria salicis]|uniref:GNAT family N-acetyltransferase n=1 Tax=Affinibrenneria salicis TaxID=2590031 RepID=A0A5J5FRB0_9GAMM|nr:GNAT family N-acetyltransferase [Affinibrenneria salicis]KAA8995643.1 GNAT family N-acetyltransferase [Affinibrenneria salicis]